ncbi:MAG: ATP-binding protein [Vulcanimicrobiaceae bacterium]
MNAKLRFSPRVLAHLGEALIPNVDQAVVELVKNSFDADATTCDVRLTHGVGTSLTLEIRDNGSGLSALQIRDRWLLIGGSTKSRSLQTPRFSRVTVGSKGLGRLAALRLGKTATITSKSEETGESATLTIDWGSYTNRQSVDEVDLAIRESGPLRSHGTRVRIEGIPRLLERDIERIGRALALISDPFRNEGQFFVTFGGNATKGGASFTRRLFGHYSYRLRAEFDGASKLTLKLHGKKNTLIAQDSETTRLRTVPFKFELYEFLLANDAMSGEAKPLADIREWITAYGGVHVFDGPIRIAPYGDKPVDWLDLNLRRVRSPELRPSTNNSIGRIVLDNSSGAIEQTTSRINFFENDAYLNMVALCQEALDWSARIRRDRREDQKLAKRVSSHNAREIRDRAIEALRTELVPAQKRTLLPVVMEAFTQLDVANEVLRDDVVLYRSMATAGITSVVFSHQIGQLIGILRRMFPDLLAQLKQAGVKELRPLEMVRQSVERLLGYVKLSTRLSERARKRKGNVLIHDAVAQSLDAFAAILEQQNIEVITSLEAQRFLLSSSRAAIDAIIANLVTNSIRAFDRKLSDRPRRIKVLLQAVRRSGVILTYSDNAGGIQDIKMADIWRAGVTTVPNGTGFGLTIVRDTVTDLGGTIAAKALTRAGGAEFVIHLPARWI